MARIFLPGKDRWAVCPRRRSCCYWGSRVGVSTPLYSLICDWLYRRCWLCTTDIASFHRLLPSVAPSQLRAEENRRFMTEREREGERERERELALCCGVMWSGVWLKNQHNTQPARSDLSPVCPLPRSSRTTNKDQKCEALSVFQLIILIMNVVRNILLFWTPR